jgi:hypothetical protein
LILDPLYSVWLYLSKSRFMYVVYPSAEGPGTSGVSYLLLSTSLPVEAEATESLSGKFISLETLMPSIENGIICLKDPGLNVPLYEQSALAPHDIPQLVHLFCIHR